MSMKLLLQGDDFGFTRGVTYGVIDSIDRGVLLNVGLFANMPSAEFAASLMKERPQVCFGVDFNILAGPSVSDPKLLPHLVDENGHFIRSNVRVKDPRWQSVEGRAEMFPYDEVYQELRAQYDKFVRLTGKKPGYLNFHSLVPETYLEGIRRIVKEEDVPYSNDIKAEFNFGVYSKIFPRTKAATTKVFDPADQLAKNTLKTFFSRLDVINTYDHFAMSFHPGYLDDELLGLTSLSIERIKDMSMIIAPEFRTWIEENNVELITYHDLHAMQKK